MNPWRGLKHIPYNIWLLAVTTLINRSGTMVLPYLAIYMNKKIGVSTSAAGMVLMIYGLGAMITAPFVGKLADKIGPVRVMRISLIVTGILLYFYSFITDYYIIIIVTFIWAVVSESFRPANLSLISFESDPAQIKTSFSLNRLAINLGMSIGPVIGGFLSQIDYSLLFYVNGSTSIIAGIFLSIVKFKEHNRNQSSIIATAGLHQESNIKHLESGNKKFAILNDRYFIIYLMALIPVCLVFFQFLGGLPLYIVGVLKYSESTFGLMMAINTVLIILIEVPLNSTMEMWDDRKAIALGSLLAAAGFGAMAISSNFILLISTIIVWTFGEMIFFPSCASYTAKISPDEKRGEYMGYFQMTFSFSLMMGPLIGAVLLDNFGATFLWSIAFVFGMISTLSFLRLAKKIKNKMLIILLRQR